MQQQQLIYAADQETRKQLFFRTPVRSLHPDELKVPVKIIAMLYKRRAELRWSVWCKNTALGAGPRTLCAVLR